MALGEAGWTSSPASRRKREGGRNDDLAPEASHAGHGEHEPLPGPGHPHVAEASLLGERLGHGVSIVGQEPFLGAHDDHGVELEPLRRVEREAEHLGRRGGARVVVAQHEGVEELAQAAAAVRVPSPRDGHQRGDVLGSACLGRPRWSIGPCSTAGR